MAFPQGIDFRATAPFVTDPTDCEAEIGTTANYPRTTAKSNTVGWEQAPTGTRNRTTGVDARLAGVHFANNGTAKNYRMDLPNAGDYLITLALGDAGGSQIQYVQVYDDTTLLGTIVTNAATSNAQFYDASGVLRTTAALWVSNNVSVVFTFASTIFRLRIAYSGATGSSTVAHIFIASSGYSDAVVIPGVTSPSSIEASDLVDSATVTSKTTPSSPVVYTDLSTISGVTTLPSTEQYGHTDSATIAGQSSPSSVEDYSHGDSETIVSRTTVRGVDEYTTTVLTVIITGDPSDTSTLTATVVETTEVVVGGGGGTAPDEPPTDPIVVAGTAGWYNDTDSGAITGLSANAQ